MNAIRLTLVALILCAASSFGGEIYGTIKEGEKPVGKSVPLEIKTYVQTYPAVTDEFGNYRVVVAETGKCAITVQFDGQSVSGKLQSYWKSVRFDWVLEKTDGRYSLKRQ
jgi:hypothetical protein